MNYRNSFRWKIIKSLSCLYCSDKTLQVFIFENNQENEMGLLMCPACKRWYPILRGIIEVLPDEKIDWNFRNEFWKIIEKKGYKRELDISFDSVFNISTSNSVKHYGFSDNMVEVYDEIAVQTPFWKKVEEYFTNKWFSRLQPIKEEGVILETACGSGRMTQKFASEGFKIVGVDITFKMIEKAMEKAKHLDEKENIVYLVADAERMPFFENTFNVCIFCGFLHHLEDPFRALKEISRTLISGGMVFGMDNNSSYVRWVFDILMKLRPLWKEEGGTHQTISIQTLYKWGEATGLKFSAVPYCFIPPHLYDLVGQEKADKLFDWTNKTFRKHKFLKNLGGLLDIEGVAS